MSKIVEEYWDRYWEGQEKPEGMTAWQFGENPDYLAQLVVDGVKTATCSAYDLYEIEGEPLPKVGEYSTILNSKEEPVCIIQTIDVQILPFNEVSEEFAYAEGEGDRSYTYWRNVHVKFFADELKSIGKEFIEGMLVVCERFKLINVK